MDWSLPLEAVDQRSGQIVQASINHTYSERASLAAVRLSRNLFTGDADAGTWYFNDDGLAVGGIGQDGYEGRYVIRNAAPGNMEG